MKNKFDKKDFNIAIIGLGYVGLPLACLLSKKFNVVGFDISEDRIKELNAGKDSTNEVENLEECLKAGLTFTTDSSQISHSNIYIVTVPTPIDRFRTPDLTPLKSASKTISPLLNAGDIVVYESTVYPGVTEGVCAKVLEESSNLEAGKDFFLGYSPERVNPGDKNHTIDKIVKIVSAQDKNSLEVLEFIYGSVIDAGLHIAPNIKTAEAAKVIENTQRDINIAIINEFAMLFDNIDIDTLDVLEAAGSKWNFLNFKPGLVGGHCISVDPYYLSHLASSLNFHTEVMDAARRTNDMVGPFISKKVLQLMHGNKLKSEQGLRVGILGLTFKKNVPDLRNSKVVDIQRALNSYGIEVDIHDPHANPEEVAQMYGKQMSTLNDMKNCDAIVLAVDHDVYNDKMLEFLSKVPESVPLLDVKGMLNKKDFESRKIWRL